MEEIRKEIDVGDWHSNLAHDEWTPLPVSGSRASARYKHAAVVVDEKLYIVGGSRNGRYLSDVQVFDLRSLTWSSLKLKTESSSADNIQEDDGSSLREAFPAISDHRMIKWGNKLLLIGGHSKKSSDNMLVRFIDLETHSCGVIDVFGNVPASRGGHSITLVGSRVLVFGGEDKNRRLLNDLHVLHLETMTWDVVETKQTRPVPRFDHTAATHSDRYLLIFGGCSHSIFYSDLHILDLQTMEWSQPHVQGDVVTPRAGHAGITIDENWYIVGGGDNSTGCLETLVLNMSKLVWSTSTHVEARHPLASEGLSVCSASVFGENILVAFGGYNGKYNNDIFVMRLKPGESSHPKIFKSPAAAAAAASVTAAYAIAKSDKSDYPPPANPTLNGNGNSLPERDIRNRIDTIKEEKRALESSIAETQVENAKLREKIDEVNSSHTELSQELQSVEGQLISERSRCFKLEAQIAELQKALESGQSIEAEVEMLRRQRSASDEEEDGTVQRQGSAGVWGLFGR
ncbi:putative galactose oxidase/kelch, beta-propeller, kelch-type beta propeller [Arabidopsis thaliana]|jgi:N-acetylneuraminic acid mutarotase|uniref:At5g04420 n=4 Tax=Arabidopsis TaxID=3701 RepID=Q9LZ83_ARATH|nr:Galactose oxidase/kelch repeat superfamily protein [Arabidopsis thaliana]NP_001031833.1 Galactose oxidase/kelch repeat superfamily protein [Arabidopsis thaliana]NP_196062.1 Galactose oxidase/kelch repeat superfamily protein [Arabidopsis thaliana]KAG7601148.1 Kelch-type beta propeller [Arabidopsis thaliana x Arabidopsis arenosa]KAG7608092.1 Kelch-type beta propeller [Arabidopsis suecica]AAU95452.1 At5g04420 [Arabidopsis thaliana]AAY25418.1 At5g04420 [Arabidopsis thaliana]AED90740.1 Galacto|eukprot:NP_001031832.1 Galactose oxidase/kelch repeat superfamily protein [Arabidopsis thaliana]